MAALPDSNVFIRYLNGDDAVRDRFEREDVRLSVIVLAELFYGALNSGRPHENLAKIDRLAERHPLLSVTREIARECGQMRHELKRLGRPIPVNDLWLAATARSEGHQLISGDEHFRGIENIGVTDW